MESRTPSEFAIGDRDVRLAAERIRSFVFRTPLVPCEALSKSLGCELFFKAENLQHIGAFKARGAMNAVLSLSAEDAARGVVTHSSGNHAAALARAASCRGIAAHVVMPRNSAQIKIDAVRRYGVEPVFCEPTAKSREETAEQLRRDSGATLIHPYDTPAVMAGQGTVAVEILEQVPDVDVVLVPVGGGGLLSGMLTHIKTVRPQTRVIAVEPEWADDAARSLKSGKIEQPTRYDTIADGLRTPLGNNTFPIIRDLLDDIVMVSENAIREATQRISRQVRLVAEPSGAVTFAAVLSLTNVGTGNSLADKKVVAVVSGGNLDERVLENPGG